MRNKFAEIFDNIDEPTPKFDMNQGQAESGLSHSHSKSSFGVQEEEDLVKTEDVFEQAP